jgi:transposase
MWVPPEEVDPVVLQAPTRKSVAVLGAVRPADGYLLAQRAQTFNTDSFQAFLRVLLRHQRRNRLIVAIVDNARWHHAEALRPWLREHRHILRLDFLPPYSPELNHQERVWKLTRRLVTHDRYFPLLDILVEAVFDQFVRWGKPNDTLRRLCAII